MELDNIKLIVLATKFLKFFLDNIPEIGVVFSIFYPFYSLKKEEKKIERDIMLKRCLFSKYKTIEKTLLNIRKLKNIKNIEKNCIEMKKIKKLKKEKNKFLNIIRNLKIFDQTYKTDFYSKILEVINKYEEDIMMNNITSSIDYENKIFEIILLAK